MPDDLIIPVVRVQQKGRTLYLGKMNAKDLLERCITTEWDPNEGWDLQQQGYQRAPIEKHYKGIAKFLDNERYPLMPTSALLAVREEDYGKLGFSAIGKQSDVGTLTIEKNRLLFIVDYQHRWRGIKYAVEDLGCKELLEFQIPVIIMADVTRYEEIRQFYLINSKQKRIDTDLGLALLQTMAQEADQGELINFVGAGRKYRIRATRLTFEIAKSTEGPWVGKIMDPNMGAQGNQVISIKSFVDSLRPVISSKCVVSKESDGDILAILMEYWAGIEQVIPSAFSNPKKFAVQSAIGAYVFHRVAAGKVFDICEAQVDYSSNNVATILKKAQAKYINPTYWKVGGEVKNFSSASGQKTLADLIIAEL